MSALAFVAALAVTLLSGGRHLVVAQPSTPKVAGVVLLIPGGTTILRLRANGEVNSTNFVIRTRQMLLDAGYAIAYMDNPGDLHEAILKLREIGRPVVLLSTSRGTIVAADNTARLGPSGPDLLILTSPVTESNNRGASSLHNVNLKSIAVPTLVVTNEGDTCFVSPPGGAGGIALQIGDKATFMTFSSKQLIGDPCEPASPHGYLGIESEVLSKIIAWIRDHTPA